MHLGCKKTTLFGRILTSVVSAPIIATSFVSLMTLMLIEPDGHENCILLFELFERPLQNRKELNVLQNMDNCSYP